MRFIRYAPIAGEYTKEFDLYEDGLSFVFGHGDVTGFEGGIYCLYNGVKTLAFR